MDVDDEEDEDEEDMETGEAVPKNKKKNKRKSERDLEVEMGDDYILDLNKKYDLANDDEKYDIIPEHWNGHNIADYVDPDIAAKLDELEKEEEEREKAGVYDSDSEEEDLEYKEIHGLALKIREKKKLMKNDQIMNNTKKPRLPRTSEPKARSRSVKRLKREFTELGVDMADDGDDRNFEDAKGGRKARSESRPPIKKAKRDDASKYRDRSGVRDPSVAAKLRTGMKKMQEKKFNHWAKAGEADRRILTKMPKHLFSGKRGAGKTERR